MFIQPLSSDTAALDSSSAVSSGITSWTGMISGNLLISWIVVGGAFLTGLATTVDGTGFGGWTTSLTCEHTEQATVYNFGFITATLKTSKGRH